MHYGHCSSIIPMYDGTYSLFFLPLFKLTSQLTTNWRPRNNPFLDSVLDSNYLCGSWTLCNFTRKKIRTASDRLRTRLIGYQTRFITLLAGRTGLYYSWDPNTHVNIAYWQINEVRSQYPCKHSLLADQWGQIPIPMFCEQIDCSYSRFEGDVLYSYLDRGGYWSRCFLEETVVVYHLSTLQYLIMTKPVKAIWELNFTQPESVAS